MAAVIVPFVLTACSNNQGKPQALIPFADSDQSVKGKGIPEARPTSAANSGNDFIRPNDGNHAVGQSFAAKTANQPSANVISNQTKFSSKTFGVAGSPRVANTIEVRKGGGRYHVGKPYSIRGIRYVPKEDPKYKAVGLASWYGPNFHGRLTANGEVYDQFALSAAHPTMPLPSYARVTNMENGASVVVRVNDRGPFARGRVIDLSSRAAQLLGYTKKGVAKVKVEYVGKARMDGLDERELLASYHPGQIDIASIPANPGRPTQVVSASPTNTIVTGERRTLKSLDASQVKPQDVSVLKVKRPISLVNGYDSEAQPSLSASRIDSLLNEDEIQAPVQGMSDLVTVELGPIRSKSNLFKYSEIVAAHGSVSIVPSAAETEYTIQVVLPFEDIGRLKMDIGSFE